MGDFKFCNRSQGKAHIQCWQATCPSAAASCLIITSSTYLSTRKSTHSTTYYCYLATVESFCGTLQRFMRCALFRTSIWPCDAVQWLFCKNRFKVFWTSDCWLAFWFCNEWRINACWRLWIGKTSLKLSQFSVLLRAVLLGWRYLKLVFLNNIGDTSIVLVSRARWSASGTWSINNSTRKHVQTIHISEKKETKWWAVHASECSRVDIAVSNHLRQLEILDGRLVIETPFNLWKITDYGQGADVKAESMLN